MPNIKSAKKALKQSKKKQEFNRKIKDGIKSVVKKSRKAIEGGDRKQAEELVNKALKTLDKAAQKGVIKPNTRDRKKSRLHAKLNSMGKDKK